MPANQGTPTSSISLSSSSSLGSPAYELTFAEFPCNLSLSSDDSLSSETPLQVDEISAEISGVIFEDNPPPESDEEQVCTESPPPTSAVDAIDSSVSTAESSEVLSEGIDSTPQSSTRRSAYEGFQDKINPVEESRVNPEPPGMTGSQERANKPLDAAHPGPSEIEKPQRSPPQPVELEGQTGLSVTEAPIAGPSGVEESLDHVHLIEGSDDLISSH
ncbi:uncharacterized protein [Fopius arisanus]|uniref:Uncharacterized protein n=1 Tax=Fopius arisanus TaxID=64838 RepID=A0A9R1TMN1_9HYME|nr:PREDICTED: uncharacterized protein LOC105272092 [Fopius arisanus]